MCGPKVKPKHPATALMKGDAFRRWRGPEMVSSSRQYPSNTNFHAPLSLSPSLVLSNSWRGQRQFANETGGKGQSGERE